LATLVAAGVALERAVPDPRPLLAASPAPAVAFLDRDGGTLRLAADRSGTRWLPLEPDRLPPYLVAAVLAAEDRRFFGHRGVDPLALLRAAWQDARAGRVVSGGSTLSMQLARLLDPRPRTLGAKLAQVVLALRLEATCTKRELLAAYLSRAPMGNRVVGFEAASRVYLGKPAGQLSPAEAALLAAVPRSPSAVNPWRRTTRLVARRDAILQRMARAGALDAAALRAALAEPVVLADDPFRFAAPHLLQRVGDEVGELPAGAAAVVTTLDAGLQRRVEEIVRRQLDALAPHGVHHIAVAVLDLDSGEWLALEGSGGFWDAPDGQQDGTRLARQPGSALKPFTYATAFDRGLSPASVLPDLPRSFTWAGGTWTPRNYDDRFHGPLTARSALARSVNVPAALVLQRTTPEALLGTLRQAGLTTLPRDASYYGLGLTLGAGEVRLDELTVAFAALLRGGEWRASSAWRSVRDRDGAVLRRPLPTPLRRVCSVAAAAQVVDILADPEARAPAFGAWSVLRLPFPAAVKTGTSEGFRDNWCVGGTSGVAVGVWAGNFDRAPMGNVSGVAGAGAVWREVMLAWAENAHPGEELGGIARFPDPPGLVRVPVCALSGARPAPWCPTVTRELLRPEQVPRTTCDWHRNPADGAPLLALPARYRDWAAQQGLALAVVPARRGAAGRLAVLAPADRDAFVLSPELPRRFQSLELRCEAPGPAGEVVWLVDGREHARVGPPFVARWELAPGVHRFQVSSRGSRSSAVEVTVYGSAP
jgi:penicillin-binding protein 1C